VLGFWIPLLTAFLVLAALWLALAVVLWLHRPSRDRAALLLRLVPDLARLVSRLMRDRGAPLRYRLALVALAAYLASPIDLIPDVVPVIGSLDDVILVALVLRWVGRGMGRSWIEAQWTGSTEGLAILVRVLALS